MKKGDNIRQRTDGRYEARYICGRDNQGHAIYGYCYGKTYEEAKEKREEMLLLNVGPRQMNLLILGAGMHGQEVFEIANSFRIFDKIRYLDDKVEDEKVIGRCIDLGKYIDEYSIAIPAVGDNTLRKKWFQSLACTGFIIPTLVHLSASVSSLADIGKGTVVCAGAVIGAGALIGKGCIIDSGAIVEKGARVPDWTLVNCGEVVASSKS